MFHQVLPTQRPEPQRPEIDRYGRSDVYVVRALERVKRFRVVDAEEEEGEEEGAYDQPSQTFLDFSNDRCALSWK